MRLENILNQAEKGMAKQPAVAIGKNTLINANTGNNVAIGDYALWQTTRGGNTSIGDQSMKNMTSGGYNTSIGFSILASPIG